MARRSTAAAGAGPASSAPGAPDCALSPEAFNDRSLSVPKTWQQLETDAVTLKNKGLVKYGYVCQATPAKD